MIGYVGLSALGAVCIAFAIVEILAYFFESAAVLRKLVNKVTGRDLGNLSDMENAAFWVQAISILSIGGVLLVFSMYAIWS